MARREMIPAHRQQELAEMVNKDGGGALLSTTSPEETRLVNDLLRLRKISIEPEGKPSDGSSADYYKLPFNSSQLQDLISFRDMNAQIGEIFRATFRYGQCPHSPRERELKKIIFYAQAELSRLEKYEHVANLGEENRNDI